MKISAWLNKIGTKIFPARIGLRIAMAYFVVITVSILFSGLTFQKIYQNVTREKVSDISMQTLSSIQTSVDVMLENANNYSKIIFSNAELQMLLRKGDIYSNLQSQSQVSRHLYNLIQAIPIIESIFIFDSSDNAFFIGTKVPVRFLLENAREAKWYDEVTRLKGAFILRLNGGGAFSDSSDGNYVSLIRQIRDVDDTMPLGILVINIPEKAFREAYANVADQNLLHVAILDENNDSIIRDDELEVTGDSALLEGFTQQKSGFLIRRIESKNHLVSYMMGNRYDWKYVSMIPYDDTVRQYLSLGYVIFIVFAVNGLVLFFSSLIISRMITVPVGQLLKTMSGVENGVLEQISSKTNHFEFRRLFDGYNGMIAQIERLIGQIVEEQAVLRKAELNALQAQIKPHFLYNSLDSIMSLALSGDNNRVCELVDALGSYYRASVSKGSEVVSVREEIGIVGDYLCIQKIRYNDMFDVRYDIDESCCDAKIPKLVLQPLAENALYHGIRASGDSGLLTIKVAWAGENIEITVEDDGVGMSSDKIAELWRGECQSGFGLWGTFERLRIFYENDDCFKLESEPGVGTKITLTISGEG